MLKTCSRPGCSDIAVAQLTYAYAASQLEVSPVEEELAPEAYALCQAHLDRLTPPKGWTLIRKGTPAPLGLTQADIDDLADRIRRVGFGAEPPEPQGTEYTLSSRSNLVMLTTRAHLRVVADSAQYGPDLRRSA